MNWVESKAIIDPCPMCGHHDPIFIDEIESAKKAYDIINFIRIGRRSKEFLTNRENEIFDLRDGGLKYREIAETLDLHISTVQEYYTRALNSLLFYNNCNSNLFYNLKLTGISF